MRVQRHYQCRISSAFRTLQHAGRQLRIFFPIQLKPSGRLRYFVRGQRNFLDRPAGHRAQHKRQSQRCRGPRARHVCVVMHNFLHANGRQQNRRRQSRAKHLHAQVALRNIPQHPRHDPPPVERFPVRAHSVFAARSARNVVVRLRREDFLRPFLQQIQRYRHGRFPAA